MTYSIVALDPVSGDLGVAVQSKFLAVGAVVPWARAGVGAVATQAFANVGFGPDGLVLLVGGTAEDALARLLAVDELRDERQVGIVDAQGGSASHTGRRCFAWAGGRIGPGFAAQGNILAGAGVVDGLADTFLAGGRPFPELLVACLAAADAAGGDRRGRESAALLVVRAGGGYGGGNDRWIDLRVDHHDDPIGELGRLLDLQHLYFDRPLASDLLALDEATADEIRAILERLGAAPGGRFGAVFAPMSDEAAGEGANEVPADGAEAPDAGTDGPPETEEPLAGATPTAAEPRPFVGEPRQSPAGWDGAWQRALDDWMSVENLEERAAAPGWIDRRVLDVLRSRAAAEG